MAVSIEQIGSLEYRMAFELSADRIHAEVQARLNILAQQVSLSGFRKGRVTPAAVEKVLGQQVRQDVISELLMATCHELLAERHIHPAGMPRIEWDNTAHPAEPDESLRFIALFEIDPDFKPILPEHIRIEIPVTEIDDTTVEERIELLRKSHATWRAVDRPAQWGDRALVDMQGYLDDESLYQIRNIPLVLGDARDFAGLESMAQDAISRSLIGTRQGEHVEVSIGFPEASQNSGFAGQTIRFSIHVHALAEPVLPELDERFAAAIGVMPGAMGNLRQTLRESMEQERREATQAIIRQQVMDALLALNPIDVPNSRVESESARLLTQAVRRMKKERFREEDYEIAQWLIRDKARDKVALDLIVARLVREAGLDSPELTEPDRVSGPPARSAHEPIFHANPSDQALESLMTWIAEHAQVSEIPLRFEQLMERWRRTTV